VVEEYRLREASSADVPFMTLMLAEAVSWRGGPPVPLEDVLTDPALARYVDEWPRPAEIGVVAEAEAGPIGVTWLCCFTSDDPGYGYVADDVPELSIGVVPEWRGRGVGRALLRKTAQRARARGIRRISLSVERENTARFLYASEGYETVAGDGDADTMVLDL
jgi:GNAT superfamily N-acetyltransferase